MNRWTNPVPTGKPLHLHELSHPDGATKDAAQAVDPWYNPYVPGGLTMPPLNWPTPPGDTGGSGLINLLSFLGNGFESNSNVASEVSIWDPDNVIPPDTPNPLSNILAELAITAGIWIVVGQASGNFTGSIPPRVEMTLEYDNSNAYSPSESSSIFAHAYESTVSYEGAGTDGHQFIVGVVNATEDGTLVFRFDTDSSVTNGLPDSPFDPASPSALYAISLIKYSAEDAVYLVQNPPITNG